MQHEAVTQYRSGYFLSGTRSHMKYKEWWLFEGNSSEMGVTFWLLLEFGRLKAETMQSLTTLSYFELFDLKVLIVLM